MIKRANFSGEQIGPYLVRERIGQGGMADVYRAYQASMSREVALKVIPLIASAEHDYLQQRFRMEAEMIAALEHPHILPVFDYGISSDVLYIAMRYLRGGTLRDLLTGTPLAVDWAADLFDDVVSALGYAHRRGIIHRDLKPSNILLDEEQNAYLADFGLAKVLGGSSQLTTTGSIVGTPAYMAPEQLRGDPIDHRVDLYSLGVILYHMLAGRPPFEALSTFSLIYQHVEKSPPSPSEFNADISPQVAAVLLQALAKNPADRFESAEQMGYAFAKAIGRQGEGHLPLLPPPAIKAQPQIPIPARPGRGGTPQLPETSALPPAESAQPVAPDSKQRSDAGWRRPASWLGGVVLVILLVAAVLFTAQPPASTVPAPTVWANRRGTPADIQPSAEDVARAQQALGEQGFIGYVSCNQTSEFFVTLARRMFDAAADYSVDLRLYDSATDANQGIIQIERARMEGAKALIVCVVDEAVLRDTLADAVEDGLPLVLHNLDNPPAFGGVIMTHDEYLLGWLPGRYAGQLVVQEMDGEADVVILDFPDLPSIVKRADGLRDGFLQEVPEANVIGRYLGGTINFGRRSIQALLDNDINIDVVLSINDAGAYGAVQALEEAGIDPQSVIVVGIDAEAQARQYIRNGYYVRATMQLAVEQIPAVLLDAAVKQLSGSSLPQVIVLPPGELITKETLAP